MYLLSGRIEVVSGIKSLATPLTAKLLHSSLGDRLFCGLAIDHFAAISQR
jgi:hypothetical protein